MIEMQMAEKLYGSTHTRQKKLAKGFQKMELTIPDGQVVGILGENGAGKSTLLRAAAGITDLTDGRILFDSLPPEEKYEEIAFITGEGSYFPNMTPTQYGEFLKSFFSRFDLRRYDKLIQFFQLEPGQLIGKMSTGQRARLEVAAGMSKRAKYLLMDEPFLGKDVITRREFLKLLAGSLRGEETILMTSHYVDEIEPFLDRAIILHKGQVAADVMMDDLCEKGVTLVELLQKASGYDQERYQKLLADGDF